MADESTPRLGQLQPLSPQEQAVLILRDVLGWELREVAELLDLRVDAANCVLQRAREATRPAADAAPPLERSARVSVHSPDASFDMR